MTPLRTLRATSLRLLLAASLLGLGSGGATLVALQADHRTTAAVEPGKATVPAGTLTARPLDGQSMDRGQGARRSARSGQAGHFLTTVKHGHLTPSDPEEHSARALERAGRRSAPSTAPPSLS